MNEGFSRREKALIWKTLRLLVGVLVKPCSAYEHGVLGELIKEQQACEDSALPFWKRKDDANKHTGG